MKHIIFSKPDINQLKREGYIPIDMHVHTNASSDGKASLLSILEKAENMGFGIAITDHNKIDSAVSAMKKKPNCFVIPGIEVFAKNERHILFYFYEIKGLIRFYNNEIKGKFLSKNTKELLKLKEKYRCIVGPAHPTGFEMWHNFGIDTNFRKADFLEVLNGNRSKKRALKSYKWALEYKKGAIGGSDAHKIGEVGKCVTCCREKTIEEVLDSIKKNETLVVGTSLSHKEIIWKIPRKVPAFGLWVLARICLYIGLKKIIEKRFKEKRGI